MGVRIGGGVPPAVIIIEITGAMVHFFLPGLYSQTCVLGRIEDICHSDLPHFLFHKLKLKKLKLARK